MNRIVLSAVLCWVGIAGIRAVGDETNAPPAVEAPSMAVTNAPVTGEQAGSNMTVITSTQLRMDTEKKIAYFDGNVLIVDPQFQLRANRLVVFLNPKGSGMDRAEAYEDVVIVQETEKRKAKSQKATYTPTDGKMILEGDPQIETDKGVTRGQKITIFRSSNTISVEGGTRTIIDLSSPPSTNAPPPESATTNAAPESATTNEPPKTGTN